MLTMDNRNKMFSRLRDGGSYTNDTQDTETDECCAVNKSGDAGVGRGISCILNGC